MHEIQVTCPNCLHDQLATKGKRGATVRCEKCSEDVLVPGVDQCPQCGGAIRNGEDQCRKCERELQDQKSMVGRIKTIGAGVGCAAIGLFIGYTGTWRALATGIQKFHISRSSHRRLITREEDPISFWLPLGFSTLICVALVLLAVAIVVGGVFGKGSAGLSIGKIRIGGRRNRL